MHGTLISIFWTPKIGLSLRIYENIRGKKYVHVRSLHMIRSRERCGSVVECLTRDRGAAGLSLTSVTALCP